MTEQEQPSTSARLLMYALSLAFAGLSKMPALCPNGFVEKAAKKPLTPAELRKRDKGTDQTGTLSETLPELNRGLHRLQPQSSRPLGKRQCVGGFGG